MHKCGGFLFSPNLPRTFTQRFYLPAYFDNGQYCMMNHEVHRPSSNIRCLFYAGFEYGVGAALVWKGEIFQCPSCSRANPGRAFCARRPLSRDLRNVRHHCPLSRNSEFQATTCPHLRDTPKGVFYASRFWDLTRPEPQRNYLVFKSTTTLSRCHRPVNRRMIRKSAANYFDDPARICNAALPSE